MKIQLKGLEMENFKGCGKASYSFKGDTLVCGDNGTGKTTIYDAYLWCIFGVCSQPNTQVQPLQDGKIVHGQKTSVNAIICINGRDIQIRRELNERYKEVDGEMRLNGNEIQRYINDEPVQKKQYIEKMNALADMEHWCMLSSIGSFMSQKVEARRALLLGLTHFDVESLVKQYPPIDEALKKRGDTDIEGLLVSTKFMKDESEKQLKGFQEHLEWKRKQIAEYDFAKIEKDIAEVDKKIDAIDKELQAEDGDISAIAEYKERISELNSCILELRQKWEDDRTQSIRKWLDKISGIKTLIETAKSDLKKEAKEEEGWQRKLEECKSNIRGLKKEWENCNKMEFSFLAPDKCELCGQSLSEDLKEQARQKAIKEFNEKKRGELSRIQQEAKQEQERKTALINCITTYNEKTRPFLTSTLQKCERDMKSAETALHEVENENINDNTKYKELRHELSEAMQKRPKFDKETDVAQIKRRKQELQKSRDALVVQLSLKERNSKIEAEIREGNDKKYSLIQRIGELTKLLENIKEYKRNTLLMSEGQVNARFEKVRWKFSEQTLSGTTKDICMCMVDGIDYNALNNAARVSAGIDIIAGLSKEFDLYAPVFIDNRESVRNVPATDNQQISLKVTEHKVITLFNI